MLEKITGGATLIVFFPRECKKGETRAALSPASVKDLKVLGFDVHVEEKATQSSGISEKELSSVGAKIVKASQGYSQANIVVALNPPQRHTSGRHQLDMLSQGTIWVSQFWPNDKQMLEKAIKNKLSLFSLTLMPRISRAQKMDVLSSQSNLGGYAAVLLGAANLPKVFPLMMTAAGTVNPAKVVIIGAGVAGLQAVATAKRLGAVVEVSDIRPEVKEQVESLGGKFIEVVDKQAQTKGGYAKEASEEFKKAQAEELLKRVAAADAVICTALIPGRPAPKIITKQMVSKMSAGSVIVDMAAEMGGNCEVTKPGETIVKEGVKIIGELNLPGRAAYDASRLYARNVSAFLGLLSKDGKISLDQTDEIISACLVVHNGKALHKFAKQALNQGGGK